ncbi:MAG: hypothetical protein HZA78_01415 [Candidatus Schekmanbacteria bacterium]|nr:hypothetical protein [Candidatus Schekmanbacteria bacterium]
MRIGIQNKIMACILIGTIAIALSTVLIAKKIFNTGFSEQIMRTGRIVAQLIGKKAAQCALTEESAQFDLLIYQIMQENTAILYIFFADNRGKIISGTIPFNYAYQIDKYNRIEANTDTKLAHFYLNNEIGQGGVYDLAQNILKSRLGTIHIGFSDSILAKSINKYNKIITGVVLLSGLGISLVSLILIRHFVRSLKNLAQDAEDIMQGKEPLKTNRPDADIESAGKTFKRLILDLQAYKQKSGESDQLLKIKTQELESAQQDLKSFRQQLLLSGQSNAVGQLAIGISHEINNPLSGIFGYSQFILEKIQHKQGLVNFTPDEFKSAETFLGYIRKEAQRCKDMAANLIKLSLDSEQTGVSSLEINQLIEDTLSFFRRQLENQHINLITDFAQNLPDINADSHRLQQVFINLINNARQAMPEGGDFSIVTKSKADNHIEIIFSAGGQGVTQESSDLSASAEIIKSHQGNMQVESKPDQGNIIYLVLPVNLNLNAA